jgi:CysZ protein
MTFAAGFGAAVRGLSTAAGNPEVRKTYRQLVLAIFVLCAGLEVGGVWGVWEWTRAGADTGWLAVTGLILLRIAGVAMVLLASPVLAVFAANLLFPALSERVFLAGLRQVAPRRAAELAEQPGLPTSSALTGSLRRLMAYVAASLGVLAWSLVPVVGALTAPWLQGYFTARMLGWELLDPYLDRLGLDHGAQRQFVGENRLALVGFALPCAFIMAVPVVGPLLFGLAQAAAGTLVVDVLESENT